jgi:hypothetical protein
MGTSKPSSTIASVFKSVEQQLESIFKINPHDEEYKKDDSFRKKLNYISKRCLKNNRLIILLDSIDQLSKENYVIIEKEVFDNEILFKHCFLYLTLFEYRGISENELEDILSLDDKVLTSIFIKYHPPVRRFPMGLWYRIKYE